MKRLTHGVLVLPHRKGGVFGHQMANFGLKNFIHFFRNIIQINIQGQNKACAIVHPQFCIPEEQTLIYSYLIAFFFLNHGWSW